MAISKKEAAESAKEYVINMLEESLSPETIIDGQPDATFYWTNEGSVDDYWFMPMPTINDGKVFQLDGDIMWMVICKKTGEVSTIKCG